MDWGTSEVSELFQIDSKSVYATLLIICNQEPSEVPNFTNQKLHGNFFLQSMINQTDKSALVHIILQALQGLGQFVSRLLCGWLSKNLEDG